MKITKTKLKQLIREELTSSQINESYVPVPEDKLDSEDPTSAGIHMDSQLTAMDHDLNSLMGEIDSIDDRFEKVKDVLRMIVRQIKGSNS